MKNLDRLCENDTPNELSTYFVYYYSRCKYICVLIFNDYFELAKGSHFCLYSRIISAIYTYFFSYSTPGSRMNGLEIKLYFESCSFIYHRKSPQINQNDANYF